MDDGQDSFVCTKKEISTDIVSRWITWDLLPCMKVSRRDFQCPLPRRLILKTNSSHFWLDSRLKHSATLVHHFKGNEIPSVFEPYEWYFFSVCIDAWLTLFIFSSLLYFYYASPASATNLKKAILPFKGRGLFTFLMVQICHMILWKCKVVTKET